MADPYSDVAAFQKRKSLHIDRYGEFSPHTGFTDFKRYKARYYRTATSGPNAGKLVDIRDPKNPVVVTNAHSAAIEKDIKAYKTDKTNVHGLGATLRRNVGSKLRIPFMTESPIADEKYSSQLSYVNRLRKGHILDPVRRFLSKPGTDGKVFDYHRSLAIKKAEQRLLELEPGTTQFREEGRRLTSAAPEVGQGYWGGADGQTWIPTSGSVDNSTSTINQPPVSNDGQPQGNAAVNGSNESQVNNTPKETAATPITANDPLKTWHRGSGESLKGADSRTEKWLVSKGVDINQISKHDKREVYRNLRIGGPHIVNGMLQLNTGRRGANSRFSLKINQS
jgi:hypothetical protein